MSETQVETQATHETAPTLDQKYKSIEDAVLEIQKLKDENAKRRIQERDSKEYIKQVEDATAERLKSLENKLKLANLAKEGITEEEHVELYDFYISKNLSESDALKKVKLTFFKTNEATPAQTQAPKGFVGKSSKAADQNIDMPASFHELSISQKRYLLENNPEKYNELLLKFKN